jgi:hypothetical protein
MQDDRIYTVLKKYNNEIKAIRIDYLKTPGQGIEMKNGEG